VAGIIVPLLPTTPFILLSAVCFSKSNKKLESLLRRNRIFGAFIENYQTKQGISKLHKIGSMVYLWLGLITSMIVVRTVWVCVMLGVVGAG